MRVAFYAPMKPPSHPVPSGDRRMARALITAFATGGHVVEVASAFRSHDRSGDERRQRRFARLGERLAARLIRRYRARDAHRRPDAWFTYHLYHKAPDWLGPAVADALEIPYVLAEASHAPKQRNGAWAFGHEAAARAIRRADAIISLNAADDACIAEVLGGRERLISMRPFVDPAPFKAAHANRDANRRRLVDAHGLDADVPWLLAVAMMREGDKLASYRALAEGLSRMGERSWQLLVVGDGAARAPVESAFVGVAERVRWLGALETEALAGAYSACDLYVWPAVNEAYGMAIVEAQAGGLAVVAGDEGGVRGVVDDGETGLLVPGRDAGAFAAVVAALLDDETARKRMGVAALRLAADRHGLARASRTLDETLQRVVP
ncbi:MAG TPA: glycosyltransferase family 4 protein [Rhodospirillales bacterium]|jgi:glycosyltransferase involved in cell wall biosynthesis|nr:glycosyltransferase family 4 protein [Rhodospirillales bacterium]